MHIIPGWDVVEIMLHQQFRFSQIIIEVAHSCQVGNRGSVIHRVDDPVDLVVLSCLFATICVAREVSWISSATSTEDSSDNVDLTRNSSRDIARRNERPLIIPERLAKMFLRGIHGQLCLKGGSCEQSNRAG